MGKGQAKPGGRMPERDVNKYRPPQGPTSIEHRKVGLGGEVYRSGTQGMTSCPPAPGSGSVGLHGESRGTGSNRKG